MNAVAIQQGGLIHIVPATEPDAAANDRFDTRLRRAALAVIHQPAPCLSDDRKMPKRSATVTGAKSGSSQ